VRQLRDAGFSVRAIFDRAGNEVPVDGQGTGEAWYHYVAEKPVLQRH
jgi:hypothetical protein